MLSVSEHRSTNQRKWFLVRINVYGPLYSYRESQYRCNSGTNIQTLSWGIEMGNEDAPKYSRTVHLTGDVNYNVLFLISWALVFPWLPQHVVQTDSFLWAGDRDIFLWSWNY